MVEQERGRTEQELRLARALQHPVGVGVLAAGMLASFPGAVALLLLAAAMSVTSGAVGQSSRC